MEYNIIDEIISATTQNEVTLLSELPDNLLDSWIVGITPKEDYNLERDIILNIFNEINEIYEGHKELLGIDSAQEDSDCEEYRAEVERVLKTEKQRRLSNILPCTP